MRNLLIFIGSLSSGGAERVMTNLAKNHLFRDELREWLLGTLSNHPLYSF